MEKWIQFYWTSEMTWNKTETDEFESIKLFDVLSNEEREHSIG